MNQNHSTGLFFQLLRNKGKRLFDNIRNEKLKENILQAIPFWLASFVTGIIAVAYSRLFLYAERGTLFVYHYHIEIGSGSAVPLILLVLLVHSDCLTFYFNRVLELERIIIKLIHM